MRISNYIGVLCITLGLFQSKTLVAKPQSLLLNSDSIRLQKNIGLIDLDSILTIVHNSYLAEFKNGDLSICCCNQIDVSQSINYKKFSFSTEKYTVENKTKKVNVYSNKSSFVKTYFNDDPEVQELDIVYGEIFTNTLLLENSVFIGMAKDSLLTNIFKLTKTFSKINTLTIYKNELGDSKTVFIFKNNKLLEILFDSSYDWIRKGQ